MKILIWFVSIFVASSIKVIIESNGFIMGGLGVFILYTTAFSIAAALCSCINNKKKKQNSKIVTDNDKFKNNDSFMKWIHGSTQSQQSYSTSEKQIESINEETSKDKGGRMEESEASTENELKVCKKCGEKLPINAIFCNKCGKKVCKKERKPLTKRKKIILFAGGLLLCICAITGSGIIGYEIGSKSGYDEGFISGRDYGWSEGHVRGYKKGLTEGRQEMINKNDDTYWKNRAQYILEKNEEENLENTSKITNDPKRQAILDKSQTTNKNQIRKCATSGCDEILTSSKNFCSLHKCKYNSCENERYLDCEYCRRHKCRDALCYEPRANDHTEYCTLHKCHVQNCNLRASYDSLYCITHTN